MHHTKFAPRIEGSDTMSYDIIDPIIIGRRIFLSRKLQGLSLRSLSRRSGVSHGYLNRLEKGQVRPSEATLLKVLDALDIKLLQHVKKNAYFDEQVEKFYNLVMYMQYEEATSIYHDIIQNHDYYRHSTRFVEYNLFVFIAIVDLRVDFDHLEEYYHLVTMMEDALNEKQKELLMIAKAIFLVIEKGLSNAWEFLYKRLDTLNDEHLKARAYYILGFTLTNDYEYYHKALEYFEGAKERFDRFMNYNRLNRCKAMEQIIYVFLHQFEDFERSYEETSHFAFTQNNKPLYNFVNVNKARYHIIQEDYTQALSILETFDVDIFQYHFYKILSYFRLGRNMEALREINRFKIKQGILVTDIDKKLIEVIEHGLLKGQDDHYLSLCKALLDLAHEERDFIAIQVGTILYTEALEARRHYKEAFHYSDKFLQVLYKIH